MEKTSTGLEENVAGLLCYVAGWISGIVFLVIEKENKFVRYHAIQSIIVFGAINIIYPILAAIFGIMGFFGGVIIWIIGLLILALWIICMLKAYQGTMFKLPVSGNMAEKWTGQSAK